MAENRTLDTIKEWITYISTELSAAIFRPVEENMDMVLDKAEERLMRIERKALMEAAIYAVLGLAFAFLMLAIFFFIWEYMHWSLTAAFLTLGILFLVIGLLVKLIQSRR